MCFFSSPKISSSQQAASQTLGVAASQLVPETKAPEANAPVFGSSEVDGENGTATGIGSMKIPKMITSMPAPAATTGANKSFNVTM